MPLVRIIKDVKHPASHYYEAYGTIAITVGSAITNMGYLTLGGVIMRNRCMVYLVCSARNHPPIKSI